MNKISLTFFTVIIGILLIVVFLQMEKPGFKIENKFIIVPQNSITANNMDHIINNIVNIASEQQNDDLIKKSKTFVKVERIAETSMFKVYVSAKESEIKAENERIIYKIFKDISQYYQINSDLKINLLYKSDAKKDSLSGFLVIIFWLLIGILVSILVVMFIEIITPRKVKERKVVIDFGRSLKKETNSFKNNSSQNNFLKNNKEIPVYDLKTSLEERKKHILKNENLNNSLNYQNSNQEKIQKVEVKKFVLEKNSVAGSESDNFLQKRVEEEKKITGILNEINGNKQNNDDIKNFTEKEVENQSNVPINLPIVDISSTNSPSEKLNKDFQQKSAFNEPNEEELKARLNKLLSGKI